MNARPVEVTAHVTKKRWGGKQKYRFNPRIDDAIREAYRQYREENSRTAIPGLAARLGWPRWVPVRRANVLGLSRAQEPYWTEKEEAILVRYGHLTDVQLQKHLKAAGFSRTPVAIHLKMTRLRIRRNLDGYSAHQLSLAFGVDSHKVLRWINRKMLAAERRGTAHVERDTFWIRHADVQRFVATYPNEIDLAKVEKFWFLDLVTNGRISESSVAIEELEKLRGLVSTLTANAAELKGQLKQAQAEISRLTRELTRASETAREASAAESVLEEERRMDRRQIGNLRRELTRLQRRGLVAEEEEPVEFAAEDRPVSAAALIAAIGRQVEHSKKL